MDLKKIVDEISKRKQYYLDVAGAVDEILDMVGDGTDMANATHAHKSLHKDRMPSDGNYKS